MQTQCTSKKIIFQAHGSKKVEGNFDGSRITSDAGCLLLREVEKKFHIVQSFSRCFQDFRNQKKVEHPLYSLLLQRIYGLVAGYEDLNDHDSLRHDFFHALLADCRDVTGQSRKHKRDKGVPLAGSSTLNRLELSAEADPVHDRYKKFGINTDAVESFFIDQFIASYAAEPEEIILDFDATDNPLYGEQEGHYFNGYYDEYCYLPLYVFCEKRFIAGMLRTSDHDASTGTVRLLEKIVSKCRTVWSDTRIVVRGDSGFCRDEIMTWCENNDVYYVFGLSKNKRLLEKLSTQMRNAEIKYHATQETARIFKEFTYRTLKSWSSERRVVGKAEHIAKGANPRFIVTNFKRSEWKARPLYEILYCHRGEMENRIKEQMLLFSDRSSTHYISSNQLRLWFSAVAYMLIQKLREVGLKDTDFQNAQCDSIRNKLLKIGAQIRVSARRIYLSFSESFPYRNVFYQCVENLQIE